MRATILVVLALGGCTPPLAPVGIEAPDPALMVAPERLPPIPADEASAKVRAAYYAKIRGQYGRLSTRMIALQGYVKLVAH